jgi:ribosomal protein S21
MNERPRIRQEGKWKATNDGEFSDQIESKRFVALCKSDETLCVRTTKESTIEKNQNGKQRTRQAKSNYPKPSSKKKQKASQMARRKQQIGATQQSRSIKDEQKEL